MTNQSTAPVGRHHAGGVGAQRASNPALPNLRHTSGAGKEVRRLVAGAVRGRRYLLQTGRGYLDGMECRRVCDRLQTWLDRTNDHVGAQSLRDFWTKHAGDVRFIVPSRSGKRTLEQLEHLCA